MKKPATGRTGRRKAPAQGPGAARHLETADELRALLAAMTDVILILDADGRYLWIAPTGAELLYKPPQELLGRTLHEVFPQETADTFLGVLREALRLGQPTSLDYTLDINGRTVSFLGTASPMDGNRVLWAARDVTERRRAETAQSRSEDRLRAIVGAEPECVKVVARDGTLLEMNPSGLRMLEADSVEELRQHGLLAVVAPEHRDAYKAMMERALLGETGTLEFEAVGLRGTRRWLDTHVVPLRDEHGEIGSVLGVSRDITERKRAERIQVATYRIAAAANTAQDLHDLLRTIHGIVGELMPARNFYVALRDPATGIVGFPYFQDEQDPEPPAPQVPGRSLTAWVMRTGEPLFASAEVYRGMLARGEVDQIGAPSVDWLGVPLRVAERVTGVLAVQTYTEGMRYGEAELEILRFVSTQVALAIERTRAQQSLRRERDLSESLITSLPGVFYLFDAEGRFLRWNVALERASGYSRDELPAVRVPGLIAPEHLDLVQERIAEVFASGESSVEADLLAKDGTRVPYYFTGRRTLVEGAPCVVGMGIDLTERRRLEQQFHQAQKMEAVGRLAGGVAHDFNNLLTAIIAQTDFLLEDLRPGDAGRTEVEEIREAADRAAVLTQQLLAFSRRQVLQVQVVDLNRVVLGEESMLRRLIGEHIRLETRLETDLWPVRADPGQLEHVIVNLAVNARDAMASGGTLTIATGNWTRAAEVATGPNWITAEHSVVPPGDYVLLTVSDTGAGMDEATSRRVFEPFFTTKERGKGTGLGLSMVYGVVKQSGGFIWVDSGRERGTTFSIHLPRAHSAVAEVRPAAPARDQGTPGTETVLLVEDEESVRSVVRTVLARRGYRVLEAHDARAALAMAERHPEPIHLLLTDVVMPVMSGRDLADELARVRPGVRVLFMSGHTDDAIVRHGVLEAGIEFIQKPFTPDQLGQRLREVLERAV